MKEDIIINTDAMIRFEDAVDSVVHADKSISGFVLVYGQAGRGKSIAAIKYYSRGCGVYVHVWQGWSQTSFMQRILFEIHERKCDMPRSRGNRCKEIIIDVLDKKRKAEKKGTPIFIDEADRLHIDRIEDLRDIHEMTGTPIILIGEEGIFGLLAERRRIWSRVVHEVEFGPICSAEISNYAFQATGLDIPPKLCGKIAEQSEGDFRLVRNMMVLIEKAAISAETKKVDESILNVALSARSWRRK